MKTCDFVKAGQSQTHLPKQRSRRRTLPGPSRRESLLQRPQALPRARRDRDRAGAPGPHRPPQSPAAVPASGRNRSSKERKVDEQPTERLQGLINLCAGCEAQLPAGCIPTPPASPSFCFRTLKFWLNLAYWFRCASPDLTEQSLLFSSATLYWLCRGAMTPVIGLTALWGHFVSDKIPTDPRRI